MPAPIQSWRPPRPKARTTKERSHYRSGDWAIKRKAVLVRDSYRCRSCGLVCLELAQVDHIIPLADGGPDEMANLQTLCVACHGRKTRGEQSARGMD